MIVLDTNVPSETSKERSDPNVLHWLAANSDELWLPSIALAELRYGVEKLADSRQKGRLRDWLIDVTYRYGSRILPFDAAAAEAHGCLRARLRTIGKPMDSPDSYIAAIALANGAPVATRNTSHFTHAGLDLIDPWSA